ncbi:peptidylprolyl isomerase [Oryzomonas sagensis]|uniref:Peptidylprolyl isomerase n=1 Tax=Oryzomonas sagensis TaxID=2603857 RepID=A0ABQ6TLE2_9BACT|nr:peptidylprolyl isomerase [Oryzomonas sagensis]KAB0669079.1 peptidylprolyl isomerase [Oryzomonas sagensis]
MKHSAMLLKSMISLWMLPLLISACSVTSSNVTPPLSTTEISATDLKKTAARVNDKDITVAELKRAQIILMADRPGLQIPPSLQKEFEMQALNQLISSELLFQAGQKLDIKDLDKQADAKLAKIKNGFSDAKDYDRALQNIGMNEKMLYDDTRRELVISNFVKTNISSKITVSDEEIKKFYDQNPDKFRQDEQIRASHILIGVDSKAGIEARKAAREKAEKLHNELLNGADFATLAKANSTCPSAKQGGDLGFFGRGKMDPQFERAAFALERGGLSNVVETRFGYHIIKLLNLKKAETVSLSEARDKIEDYLRTQKTNAAIGDFVGGARRSAKIDVLLP